MDNNTRSSHRMSTSSASTATNSGADASLLRSRNKRRDDALRKKVESELNKKPPTKKQQPKKKNTVSSLKPAPAITVLETARIVQAAQLMAAKRADAVLAINEEGQLSGILTDKDIAYRVVADGLDIRSTTVAAVMTRNPISVYDKGNRNEALNIMVERKFRHLPVITEISDEFDDDEEQATSNVVGLLDITKCVFERLDDLERKVNEDQSIISAMEVLERRGTVGSDHVGQMRVQHSCPDLATVIQKTNEENDSDDVAEVGIKATVREAARVMKEIHSTAVLVLNSGEGDDRLGGIFTTKDIVLRVVAAGLDPNTTSVVRVMTPHPDSVSVDTSILDALKKLHIGHYLHLPVVDGTLPVGLVDVLQLTIAMLNYLVSKDHSETQTQVSEGPMWNRFWNSTFHNDDISDHQSVISESIPPSVSAYPVKSPNMRSPVLSHPVPQLRYGGGLIGDDQSVITSQYGPPPSQFTEDSTFAFKLKIENKVYRFVSTTSFSALCEQIYKKTGVIVAGKQVGYVDDEGDFIGITGDKDLEDAVKLAKRVGWSRLVIEVDEKREGEKKEGKKEKASTNGGLVEFLKEAPVAVNVAISAAVVVAAAVVINRLTRY